MADITDTADIYVLWIILFRFRRRRMYKLASDVQGSSEELPFIGIAHTLVGATEDIMSSLQRFSYEAMKHNGILRFWLGPILYFILLNPVDAEAVLRTCLEKDDLHRFMRKVIGQGVVFAPVAIWRRRRKIMVPAFNRKNVENSVETFSQQSQKLVDRLNESVGCDNVSIWPYISTYTLDAVCESSMGIKINAQGNPKTPFLVSMQIMLNVISKRIFHLWLQPDWLFKFFPDYSQHKINAKILHDFTDEVIRKKRLELKSRKNLQADDNSFDLCSYKKQSFLELLISISGGEKGYTNEELREEILTLAIAGTDTSALCIGYTLKLLAKYPKVQEKVFEELQEVFCDSDRPLVKEDLYKLKFLDRVIKESLRLYPPAPFIIRKVLEDISLPSGKILPAGSGVAVSIWGIHRDPKYWGPDAEWFDPDRFLPERLNLQHPCSYMPFSYGPRNCIGYQYSLMSIKTAVSTIVRRYKIVGDEELGPIPHIKCKMDIMMKDVDEFRIGLEKRCM